MTPERRRRVLLWAAVHLGLVAVVIGVSHATPLDFAVQDRLFDWDTGRWPLEKDRSVLALFCYRGPKAAIAAFGLACAVAWALSVRVERLAVHRRTFALITVALAVVPISVGLLKKLTNVYTPSKIDRYGGRYPYAGLLESYPDWFVQTHGARGWPAAHASTGYALVVLGVVAARPARRWAGYATGVLIGSAMGVYQIFKGAHFVCDTLVSLELAFVEVLLLAALLRGPAFEDRPRGSLGVAPVERA